MKKIILPAVLLIMAACLTACGMPKSSSAESPSETEESVSPAEEGDEVREREGNELSNGENTITVSSSEEVSVTPDIAEVVYCVRTQAGSAAECQQKNAKDMSAVIELLTGLGVRETSIQTSDYRMNPVYNYSNNTQKVVGYEAVATLTVSDILIESLDELLTDSVSSGVNTVQSVTYKASGYDEGYEEALTRAVAAAYRKAKVLADASGASVGKVIRIEELGGYSQARYTDYARTGMANASAKMAEVEDMAGFMAGEIKVEAKIAVEYELIN